MGQRHQAWIIARVKPHGGGKPRYRCIGGIHHQWCYGSLPLKGLIRIATLLQQKPNADIVQEELRAIEGKYGSHLAEAPKIPNCPYVPYISRSSSSTDAHIQLPLHDLLAQLSIQRRPGPRER